MKKLLPILLLATALIAGCGGEKLPELNPPYILANLQSFPFTGSDLLLEKIGDGQFNRTGSITIVRPEQAKSFFGDMTEQYLTYWLVGAASTSYDSKGGKLFAELLEFADNTRAYGYYALKRPDGASLHRIGAETYTEGNSLYLTKGPYVLTLSAEDTTEAARTEILALAGLMNDLLPSGNHTPPFFKLFPFSGKLYPSQKYFPYQFREIPGLDDLYTTRYVTEADTLTLFMAMDTLGYKYKYLKKYLEDNDISAAEVKQLNFDEYQGLAFEMPEGGVFVCGLRQGKLLGALGYQPKFHQKLFSGWINGFQ